MILSPSSDLRGAVRAAVLTLALSLPQGLLALPIAVAQFGLMPALLTLLAVGLLNTASTAWAAGAAGAFFVRHGAAPSLPQLAAERLGPWGGLLARAGGAGLFFLALVASLVGLGHSLAALGGAPAPLWAAGCGLLVLVLAARGAALSLRLLVGLGLLNLGLLIGLTALLLPQAGATAPAPAGAPLTMLGVSQMLFFAPMLLAPVAQQVLGRGCRPRALVLGCAAGVAAGALIFGLWAVAVCGAAGGGLGGAGGTALPALIAAAPAARLPGLALGLSLLGMTALRCALVLRALADEQLPARFGGRWRGALAQLPAALALGSALALALGGAASFTQIVAVAGACAASLCSLAVPGLLAAASARARLAARLAAMAPPRRGGRTPPAGQPPPSWIP